MPNIYKPEFDEPRDKQGFQCKRSRIGWQIGSRGLGASLWELPPGQSAYPYHYHLTEEEMLLVLKGTPTLKSPDGIRELQEGEAVCFQVGEQGGHQIINSSDADVQFLSISTNGEPDIVIYPDSNKVGVNERIPDGSGLRKVFKIDDEVDYWDGEKPPDSING